MVVTMLDLDLHDYLMVVAVKVVQNLEVHRLAVVAVVVTSVVVVVQHVTMVLTLAVHLDTLVVVDLDTLTQHMFQAQH
jgi:hypothetical protein